MSPPPPATPASSAAAAANFRQLLPADGPDPARRRASSQALPKDGPRKSYVLAACEACRRRKSKCSGERPICLVCSRRGSTCHYTTSVSETRGQALKRRYNQLNSVDAPHRNLVELLKSISDDQALAIIRRLRAGDQPELVLGQLSAGNALLELAVKPETRFRYAFPVMSEMPPSLLGDNPYLDSFLYEAASVFPSPSASPQSGTSSPSARELSVVHERREIQNLYVMPYHAAEAIVPRLCSVCPSAWTRVSKDDVLMRDLLASYFKNDYNTPAHFHIDYFLEDMATGRTDFCSSLLVNAVLAIACGTYMPFEDRAEYWNPDALSYKFLVEARRLWEIKAHPDYVEFDQEGNTKPIALTTIQAGLTIQVAISLSCMDRVAKTYMDRAVQMAVAIDLFNYSNAHPPTVAKDRLTIGRAFTAWSLYNWETLMSYHFFVVPALTQPPRWKLPDLAEEPRWYGDVALKYPDTASLSPTHLGQFLHARCHLRVILNELSQVYFCKNSAMGAENIRRYPESSLAIANGFYARLEAWARQLPPCLTARQIALPAHFQLHCYYQAMTASIYGPVEDVLGYQTPSPKALVKEARRRMVTLLRLYYLRHGFESADSWIAQPLVMLANMYADMLAKGTLAGAEVRDAQATLVLLVKGLRDQSRNHSVAELLFRMVRAKMRPEDQALLLSEGVMRSDTDEAKVSQMHAVQMSWPAMATTMADDPHNQTLSELARTLGQVTVAESKSGSASPLKTEDGSLGGE